MLRWNIGNIVLFLVTSVVTIHVTLASEKSDTTSFGKGNKVSRGLNFQAAGDSKGKPSSRFFSGMPPSLNPVGSYFPTPFGAYGTGSYPSFPYLPYSTYGLMGGPMNYGGLYPQNSGNFGNSFGGFSTSQQQQQQQQSHTGIGTGFSGFQPTFSG